MKHLPVHLAARLWRCPRHQVTIPAELRVKPEPASVRILAIGGDQSGVNTELAPISSRRRAWLGCLVLGVIGLVVILSLIPFVVISEMVRQRMERVISML